VIEVARDVPVNINMGFGIRSRPTTPLIPLSRLKAMGVARVSLPRFMTSAALSGMQHHGLGVVALDGHLSVSFYD